MIISIALSLSIELCVSKDAFNKLNLFGILLQYSIMFTKYINIELTMKSVRIGEGNAQYDGFKKRGYGKIGLLMTVRG